MMVDQTLTFSCPACKTILTVPRTLSGTVGNCPSCQTSIRAPLPVPALAIEPVQALQTLAPTQLQPQPQPQLQPQPRPAGGLPSKELPTPEPETPSKYSRPRPSSQSELTNNRSSPPRILLWILFLLACGALIYGVTTLLTNRAKKTADVEATSSVQPVPPTALVKKSPLPTIPGSTDLQTPSYTATDAKKLNLTPPIEQQKQSDEIMPGIVALEVLGKFLAAKTLAERLPLIETKIPLAELENSILARPLPTFSSILIETQEANAVEKVLDIYYNVDFDGADGHTYPQTLLMRKRGSGTPKLVVEPFLDLFGGRLAAFASKPSSKDGVFRAIVSAMATCTNENVPNREKKLTLKLLSRDNTREIAQAYFGRQSKIGRMLEDGSYNLSYGKAKACTVLLRWNTEEFPAKPYLEAVELIRLDWNP